MMITPVVPCLRALRRVATATRLLRFAGTGGTAAVAQVTGFTLLIQSGWNATIANVVAFLLAAQINFALSVSFTWADRRDAMTIPRRWARFHASIALMAIVNMAVFTVARTVVAAPAASLLGIAVGAVGNYALGDHFVFRRSEQSNAPDRETQSAA